MIFPSTPLPLLPCHTFWPLTLFSPHLQILPQLKLCLYLPISPLQRSAFTLSLLLPQFFLPIIYLGKEKKKNQFTIVILVDLLSHISPLLFCPYHPHFSHLQSRLITDWHLMDFIATFSYFFSAPLLIWISCFFSFFFEVSKKEMSAFPSVQQPIAAQRTCLHIVWFIMFVVL